MKVVTICDVRVRASEMFRSDDVILVTHNGAPAGFYPPWTARGPQWRATETDPGPSWV
jgi:hypothetical protein